MYEHRPRPVDHNGDEAVPTGSLSKKGIEVVNFTISDLDPCHIEARREESGQRIIDDMRVSARSGVRSAQTRPATSKRRQRTDIWADVDDR